MKQSIQQVIKMGAISVLVFAVESQAVLLVPQGPVGSGVQSRFASQSQAYMASDPVGLNPWPNSGPGIYATGAPIPGLPAAPAPSVTPAPGNAFSGAGWTSSFNDLNGPGVDTVATSTLTDSFLAVPSLVSDTQVVVSNWSMLQASGAPGYAYNQLNFGSNYVVTDNVLLGGSTPNFPLFISGSVAGGVENFAKFDAVIDYTWIPGKYDFPGGTFFTSGPNVALGTLTYSYLKNTGGAFSTTLTSSGSLIGTTDTAGIISITGHMWIAGDPFEFNATSLPEPTSLGLLTLASLGLVRRKRK